MKTLYSGLWADFHPLETTGAFSRFITAKEPDDLDGEGVLVIHGGADISPALYGQTPSRVTGADAEPSYRDVREWALMQRAVKLGMPIFGICRGAQMLCALAGGFLVQDVSGHHGTHTVITEDGQSFDTNSIHHQMMVPAKSKHRVIAKVPRRLSRAYIGEFDKPINIEEEPEFIYFEDVKGIAIQWHPEMMSEKATANRYVIQWMQDNNFL